MATEVERLLILLEARTRKFERQLAKANGTANKRATAIENRFKKMNRNLSNTFKNSLRGALPALGVAVLASEFKQLADANTRIQNALKVTGLEGKALDVVYNNLFASAQKNFVPLESLVDLYSRAALVQNELGVSTKELTEFTDNVALALRVSGKSAAESSGALLQLSQALGSGIVRAEEFNSLLEGAPTIAQAAAAGLREAGGSVAKLRTLVIDGRVSSEAFFRAFEAGAPTLASKVANAEVTASQALTRLRNELTKSVGRFDKATGASKSFSETIASIADNIGPFFDFLAKSINRLDELGESFSAANKRATAFFQSIGAATGLDRVGEFIADNRVANALGFRSIRADARRKSIADQYRLRATETNASAIDPGRFGGKPAAVDTGKGNKNIEPVSLDEYGLRPSKKKPGGRKRRARESDYAREIGQIRERTEAIRAETAAQGAINPLVNDYGFALEKTRAVHELMTAAQRSGLTVTPELRENIEKLAGEYANASVHARKLAESQDEIAETAQAVRDFGKDVLGGFISDLRQGKSASEALQGALGKVADKLLEISLNNLFDSKPGRGGGGFLSAIGSFLGFNIPGFARGTNSAPGGLAVVGERGPELVNIPRGSRVIPNHNIGDYVKGVGGSNRSQEPTVNYAPVYHIDARGADQAAVDRLERGLAERDRQFGVNVANVNRMRDLRSVRA